MAGSIISGSDVSRRVEHITDPFRNLFVALFFVSVGTQINPAMLWELWLPIILISAGVIIFQSLACFAGVVMGGVACRDAYLAAVNKAQIGEFSFVIAGLGISSGVMDPSIMAIAMGVSFLTVFVNPIISARSEAVMRLARPHGAQENSRRPRRLQARGRVDFAVGRGQRQVEGFSAAPCGASSSIR